MAKKKKADIEPEESSGGSIAVNDAWTGMLAISLLALMAGAGMFLYELHFRYDYFGTNVADVKVPKLTSKPPGDGGGGGKQPEKKEPKEKVEDKKDEKKEEKKDASVRPLLYRFAQLGPHGPKMSAARLPEIFGSRTRHTKAASAAA